MGWWGYKILEGDTPRVCRREILAAAGVRDVVENDSLRLPIDVRHRATCSVRISSALVSKVLRICSKRIYTVDELDHSAAMTVFAKFALANNLALPAQAVRKIRAPIQFELDNIADMGWDVPARRQDILQRLLTIFDQGYRQVDVALNATMNEGSDFRRQRTTSPARRNHFAWTRYELRDPSTNTRKFWEIRRLGTGYETRYGRIDGTPRYSSKPNAGAAAMGRIIQSKLRKGYREVTA